MRPRLFYLFILAQLCGLFSASAQQQGRSGYDDVSRLKSYYPVSTEAARLFRRLPESMDYARGRATIRIPVFEVKAGGLTLPISLAYTTGGIRVTDQNGAVALGWTLEAEPAISREVRGEPDERHFMSNRSEAAANSLFFQYKLSSGLTDVCADIFHYRMLSCSGKFLLESNDRQEFIPQLLGDRNVSISTPDNGRILRITEIDLQEADGTRYRFGGVGCENTHSNSGYYPTTWKAEEITSPHGEKISFSYNEYANHERHPVRYDYYAFEDNEDMFFDREPSIPETPGYWKGVDGEANYYHYAGDNEYGDPTFEPMSGEAGRNNYGVVSTVSVKYVSQIRFPNGTVSFTYATSGSRDLQEIRVADLSGKTLKKVNFVKHTCPDGRILLDQILVTDGSGDGVEKYAFEYYPCPRSNGFDIYSKAMDYWGYYNGRTGNTDLVPLQKVSFLDKNNSSRHEMWIGGADREASFGDCLSYALKSVTYPTGGKTDYTYELHRVGRGPAGVTSAGGLRLYLIEDTQTGMAPIQRFFTYYGSEWMPEDERGMGNMRYPIAPWAFNEQLRKCYLYGEWSAGIFLERSRDYTVYSSNNIVCEDNDVYYEAVVETTDGNSVVHYFSNSVPWNFDDDYFDDPLHREYYDENIGNSGALSSERETDYSAGGIIYRTCSNTGPYCESVPLQALRRRAMVVNCHSVSVDQIPDYQYFFSGNVSIENRRMSADKKDDSRYTSTYSPQGYIKESSKFIYTDSSQGGSFPYHLVREQRQTDASGSVYTTRYTYPFDGSDAVSLGMTANGLNACPVERKHYKDGVLQKVFRYTYRADATVTGGYVLQKISESTGTPHTQFVDVETYDAYLSSGKPLQATRSDGTPVCFLWGYEHQSVIAVVENATVDRVRQLTGLNPETVAAASTCGESTYTALDGLRGSLPEARVTTYRYRPLCGVTQVKGPDGQSTYSEYDAAGRLSEVKDTQGKAVTKYEYNVVND